MSELTDDETELESGIVRSEQLLLWWDFRRNQQISLSWQQMTDLDRYDFVMSNCIASFLSRGMSAEALFDLLRGYRNNMVGTQHMTMIMWLDGREENIRLFAECYSQQQSFSSLLDWIQDIPE